MPVLDQVIDINEVAKKLPFSQEIGKAQRQQAYYQYLVETQTENSTESSYTDKISKSVYQYSNPLSNWIKTQFKEENFIKLSKYIRHPNPVSKIIKNEAIPDLKKVFDAQDPSFFYEFTTPELKENAMQYYSEMGGEEFFRKEFFEEYIYRYNSLLIEDVRVENEPYYTFVNINQLKAIDFFPDDSIKFIYFVEEKKIETENGEFDEIHYLYDSQSYRVYVKKDNNFIEQANELHDLGKTPAHWIARKLNSDSIVQRANLIVPFQQDLETFIFNYALFQRLKVNGGYPAGSHYAEKKKPCGRQFNPNKVCRDGYLYDPKGGTFYGAYGEGKTSQDRLMCDCQRPTPLEAGYVAAHRPPTEPGATDLHQNGFIKFYFVPVEVMEWWEKYLDNFLTKNFLAVLLGRPGQENGQAKNRDQVRSIRERLENTVRDLSEHISSIRQKGDTNIFNLRYGSGRLTDSSINYGTIFYFQTENELIDLKEKSTDPLERSEYQDRIDTIRFRTNPRKLERKRILRALMPYSDTPDDDFSTLVQNGRVSDQDAELRYNFTRYITELEGSISDIMTFVSMMSEEMSFAAKIEQVRQMLILLVSPNIQATPQE